MRYVSLNKSVTKIPHQEYTHDQHHTFTKASYISTYIETWTRMNIGKCFAVIKITKRIAYKMNDDEC